MKKLKLFISLWFTMFSMVVFGQAEYEKIAITANTQDNLALKVNVQSSSNEINWKYIKDFQKEKEYLSTGLIKSGVISINGDNTKYNVTAGIGIITNFDDPENPTSTIINFPAVVAKTPSYLTTSNITYIAINSSGTVTESATPFTPEQRRTLIILGAVIHSNLTNINVVNNISAPTNASTNQLHDLMEAIGALNLSGNKFSANNANLLMNKSAGTIFKLGSNFVNDWKNPHVLGQAALTGLTFRYRTQNGTEGADVTSINPNVYDLNNVLTAVPSNRYSIQTITLFQSGLVRVQYGQNTYATISEAEAEISTRNFNVESNIALNGITRAYLLVKEGTTSLSNPTDAKFVDAGKFGSITSGGGAITLASIIAALGYTPENIANKQNSLATDGSGVKYPTVDAVNTKVSNIDNTSDLNKPISTATQTALNLKENTANKNIANGYAGLGNDGKLISSQLPSITITDTFVVGSQSAMLSLVAETGDVAVRTDVNKSFILQGDTPSDLADWQELLTPTSTVSSVFGRTGAVTSNVGDYTADQISETASRKFQTLAQQTYNDATSSIQTQINAKANDASVVHKTGNETIAGVKTFSNSPILSSVPTITTGLKSLVRNPSTGEISEQILNFSKTIYFNSSNPTTATIFSLDNPPIINDNSLKNLDGAIYVGDNAALWTSNGVNYSTYTPPSSTSSNPSTFLSTVKFDNDIFLKQDSSLTFFTSYTTVASDAGGIYLGLNATKRAYLNLNNLTNQRNFTFPDASGTLALTSDLTNKISGTGTTNYIPKFTGSTALGNSSIYDNGTNVGIGTGSPVVKLDMTDVLRIQSSTFSAPASGMGLELRNVAGASSLLSYDRTNALYKPLVFDASDITIKNNGNNGIYLSSVGKVGIGTTSPSEKLNVAGNGLFTGSVTATGSNSGFSLNRRDNSVYAGGWYSPSGSILLDMVGVGTALSFAVTTGAATFSSNVTATGFFQSSDSRLKDIISRDGDVIKYKWKDKRDDKIHIGYVAQEVQKENPDQVNADDKGILSVNYIEILVQKIKDLENRIKQLEK